MLTGKVALYKETKAAVYPAPVAWTGGTTVKVTEEVVKRIADEITRGVTLGLTHGVHVKIKNKHTAWSDNGVFDKFTNDPNYCYWSEQSTLKVCKISICSAGTWNVTSQFRYVDIDCLEIVNDVQDPRIAIISQGVSELIKNGFKVGSRVSIDLQKGTEWISFKGTISRFLDNEFDLKSAWRGEKESPFLALVELDDKKEGGYYVTNTNLKHAE